ncbi:MAG: hypothetical protein FJ336_02940 [Sphingomonadales bacterium]|nr:hypothetical protein [Sphingomonadales bacterium]
MPNPHRRVQATIDARARRALNNLMGIIKGITCDGALSLEEINFLREWMGQHSYITDEYPANVISRKLHESIIDGVVSSEEQQHLLLCLQTFCDGKLDGGEGDVPAHIARLFDDDPSVIFEGNFFVLTGDFLFGPRSSCERAILKRGGIVRNSLSGTTSYLIVGSRSSPAWIEETWGRKLQRAAELIDSGDSELAVIREADWVVALDRGR